MIDGLCIEGGSIEEEECSASGTSQYAKVYVTFGNATSSINIASSLPLSLCILSYIPRTDQRNGPINLNLSSSISNITGMPIRIRLARHGRRNNPYYHIVAIQSSKRRDAKPLEKLGEYDPIPRLPSVSDLPSSSKVFGNEVGITPKEKRVEWNVDRIKYWLGVGAQPSLTVVKLLERVGYISFNSVLG